MSNLYANESLIATLNNISMQFNRYAAICIFLFGVVGNILNILVLSQRSFRSNSCAWIFLASSFVNLISILSGLITIIIGGWTTNPANYIGWICKIRANLVFTTRTIAPWLIVLATVDRWLLSSTDASRRRKSTLANAKRWTLIIVVLSVLLYLQMFYCYEANLNDTPLKCYGKIPACRFITDLSFAIITILLPMFFMILFGLLTIYNVRQSQRRLKPTEQRNGQQTINKSTVSNTASSERKSKQRTVDRTLLRMLLVQVLLLAIFTIPLSLDKFYSTFTGDSGDAVEQAINMFVYDLAILTYFISNGLPFYIYTLFGGSMFRKALYEFFSLMKRKIVCH